MTKRARIIAGLALLIVVVVTLGVRAWRSRPVANELIASGTVEATEARLGFQTAGRLASISAVEGDSVSAGQELALLDRGEMRARLEQAEAQAAAARAALVELEAGARSEEIAQARAAHEAALRRQEDARRDLDRMDVLHKGGAVSQESYDKAALALDQASSQAEQAAQQLQLLVAGPRRERLDTQRAQVAQAEAAVRVLDATLETMSIRAPFSGVITVRHREPGETVPAGSPVLTLMKRDERWLRIYVPEARIGAVRLGQRAAITCDSFPDKSYAGEVVYIAGQAEFTPKSVQTTEERVKLVYAVKVRISGDPGFDLKPGMPADLRLELGGS